MSEEAFEQLRRAMESGGPSAAFNFLAQKFLGEKNYPALFEARAMKLRHDLGLPLLDTTSASSVPADIWPAYDQGFRDIAREVGSLFLEDGDIERAWPYFRAIGDPAPVAQSIADLPVEKGTTGILNIAYHEGVNPGKGFEFILANYGICRAIQSFSQYPGEKDRDRCIRLMVRTLYADLVEGLKWTIRQREASAPETSSAPELISGRDWLFEGESYYVDSSHLISVLRYSLDLEDRETLTLAAEMADYGTRLSPTFQYPGDPPFEDSFKDHGVYLRALLDENGTGADAEAAVRHFRQKMESSDPQQTGSTPAQVLVELLARLRRYPEAIAVSLERLGDTPRSELSCPSVMDLCRMNGDSEQLMRIAHQRGDLLSFTAAALELAEKTESSNPSACVSSIKG
jgi:hypothetical protein